MNDTRENIQAPVFLSAADQPPRPAQARPTTKPIRPSETFVRMVSADLRDKFTTGPAYKVLSRPENRVAWLQALHDIRDSIGAQNGHDNALLATHPDRAATGGPVSEAYAEAKRMVQDRKRRRLRVLQAVTERIGEVRRLIGVEPLEGRALGVVVDGLLAVQRCVAEGRSDDASQKIAALLRDLAEEAGQ
jgi:hypothetical protein